MKHLFRKYKPHYVQNLTLAIPVVISQLGHTLVHTADSVIVGHFVGTIPLAAVSLVNSLFMIMMVIGIGVSYGLTPLIAQENGRGNTEECGKLLINSLLVNIVIGMLLFLIMYAGATYFLEHLDQQASVVAQAKPYLKILGLSIVPLMIFLTFKQFAEGLGFTKQAMVISIWGNVINVLIGISLVKGLFGIEPMGISGVGYSTLTDRILMSVVMTVYVLRSKHFKAYLTGFKWSAIQWRPVQKILKLGTPTALQYTFEVGAFSVAAILAGSIGAIEQAAHQVAINLASITYMMAGGISAAATIQSGNHFGRRKFLQLQISAVSSYHISLLFMSFTALMFIFLNAYLPYFYTNDLRVISIASGLLIIAAVFQLFDGAQVVGLGILRGIGDVNIPTMITFVAYWILGLPLGYYLAFSQDLGIYGIWAGLTLGLFTSSVLLFIRFYKHTKSLNLLKENKG